MTVPRRPGRRTRSLELPTEIVETVQMEGLPAGLAEELRHTAEKHRRTAQRYLRAGNGPKAFAELVKASRAGPMTPRLAAYVARFAPLVSNVSGAVRLLTTGVGDASGTDRVRIQMSLARLLRRDRQLDRALEVLREVLREQSLHGRAHRLVCALLTRKQEWEALDEALAAYRVAADSAQRPRVAAQLELERARLWSGPGGKPARGAVHHGEAARRLGALGEHSRALESAVAQIDALEESGASAEQVGLALEATLPLAERAGDVARAEAIRARSKPARASRATRPAPAPAPARPASRRHTSGLVPLIQLARRKPLDAAGYAELAQHYASRGDAARAAQLDEVAIALQGKSRAAVPRAPQVWLTETDRAGLRHPTLRNPAGELFAFSGAALCQLGFPPSRRLLSVFRVNARQAGPLFAEALLAAVRILGLRASELLMGFRQDAPIEADFIDGDVRLVLSRRALRRPPSEAVLRFFAGRALFAQSPDLCALRLLPEKALGPSFELLGAALEDVERKSREARLLSDRLHPKGRERLRELHAQSTGVDLVAMREGATHSINRAGLVVSGALGPALAGLERIGASRSEREELVRFAASPRYLELRLRAGADR